VRISRSIVGHCREGRLVRALLIGGWLALAGLQAANAAQTASAGSPSVCGDISNAYGPYDYRTDRDKLGVVERFDYTLRAFPNHHRALMSMAKLGALLKTTQAPKANYSVDCYFDRAIRFAPDDRVARLIFAQHLFRTGREDMALQQVDAALQYAEGDAFGHFNIGLVLFEFKRYDRALVQAHRAMALGLPRTELKEQLQSVGRWVDP
jgi:tetratricopeptide (TPR) repeat protein